jgi:hypothetical protein
MPIELTSFTDDLCCGYIWKIIDETKLAELVASLIIGRYRHVSKILSGIHAPEFFTPTAVIDKAISTLQTPTIDEARWHRDGWVFQMIAWVAIHRANTSNAAISIPHPRPTNKGFDALFLTLPATDEASAAVVICEDKATENSRKTIREDVWPEFLLCEKGARDDELISEITALLERHSPERVDELISQIHWEEKRQYRVSITTNEDYEDSAARSRLFKGYGDIVFGDKQRRRAETIRIENLRTWMNEFCEQVIFVLNSMRQSTNV